MRRRVPVQLRKQEPWKLGTPKEIAWMGTARDDLIGQFPIDMRKAAGQEWRKVQYGLDPTDAKSIRQVGPGAYELRFRDPAGWYRIIYVAKFETAIYVLHAFAKKTNATAKSDIDLARKRYAEARKDAGAK